MEQKKANLKAKCGNVKNEPVIELKDVTFKYRRAKDAAIKNVDLTVHQGEFLCIMGPTGAGKSTLLYLMSGAIPLFHKGQLTGEVLLKGKSTKELGWEYVVQNVGFVLEDPEAQLFNLFVEDELMWGLENLGLPKEEIIKRKDQVSEFFGIKHLLNRVTYDVSGGEKQKIAMASIYAMQADILLLDEPTSELDPVGTGLVFDAIHKIAASENKTIVMAEHKSEEIAKFADRVVLINNGQILSDKRPEDFFADRNLLKGVGIDIPQICELSYALKADGFPLSEAPLNIDKALPIFGKVLGLSWKRKRSKK